MTAPTYPPERLSFAAITMTTTETYSGLSSPLRARRSGAVALSATQLAFPAGGSATCPPAAKSVRRAGLRLIVRMRPPNRPCTTSPRSFTVVVTVDRPALRNTGLRSIDVGYNARHQRRLTLAT